MNTHTVTIPDSPAFDLPAPTGSVPALPADVVAWFAAATTAAATLTELLGELWDKLDAADEHLLAWCRTMTGDDDAAAELLWRLQDAGGSGRAQTLLLAVRP